MVEQCPMEGCEASNNGVCLLHGVEVERRINSEKNMAELKDLTKALIGSTKSLYGTQKWVLGVLSVLTIMMLGSYTFSAMIWKENIEYRAVQAVQGQKVTELISALTVSVKLQDAQNIVYNKNLEKLTNSMDKWIEIQRDFETKNIRSIPDWGK